MNTVLAADPEKIRIGNCSGFYGDRFTAMREMLTDGELDVLTGDYLAELTMLILARDRTKNPKLGYAKTFLKQMQDCLSLALDTGVQIVVNAGGLNPAGLTARLRDLAEQLGLTARFGYVEGDDLTDRADTLGPGKALAANAYLGGWGITECLLAEADVVVTGRVTDAALVTGTAAAHFGWGRDDYDRLAGAVVAGHVIECGAQATGGNYSFFREVSDPIRPGFPIAEIHRDGSSVITKHQGTGGSVTVDTVTAQLMYEIQGARYLGPDVTTRLDTVELSAQGTDRVMISGVRGEPPPGQLKISQCSIGGFRNELTFVLTGLDIEPKAKLARAQLESTLPVRPAELTWTLARTDRPDAQTEEQACALLRCVVRDPDPATVGRSFADTAVALALSSYPGCWLTTPPSEAVPFGVFTARYLDAREIPHTAVLPDATKVDIAPFDSPRALNPIPEQPMPQLLPKGPCRSAPLGMVAGARSGDKGGNANIGVWVRTELQWRWLAHELTIDRLRELLPETSELIITRTMLPNLRAVNFVIEGLLGAGVAYQARFDPQAKGLAEWLRARYLSIPEELLP